MSTTNNPAPDPEQAMICEIRLEGHLGQHWADWFGGLTITHADNGETLLSGPVADQAALHSLLKKVRDLGVPLRSVICDKVGQTDGRSVHE